MQLTMYTDYSLRVLIYLALRRDDVVTIIKPRIDMLSEFITP